MSQELIIPHNTSAEQAVLGSCLINTNQDQVRAVVSNLRAESFYTYAHKVIFEQIQYLLNRNQSVDLVTLDNRLNAVNLSQDTGGFAYLAEMAKNTPSAANINRYAEIIKTAHLQRCAIQLCQSAVGDLFTLPNGVEPDEVINRIGQQLDTLRESHERNESQGLRPLREVADVWLTEQEERKTNPDSVRGITTGIASLDALFFPKYLLPGTLFVIGARPKVGKTSLYTQLALNCALNEKMPVLMFSLEMPSKQIFERILAQQGRFNTNIFYLPTEKVRAGALDTAWGKVSHAMQALFEEDLLFLDDTPAIDLGYIKSQCRKMRKKCGQIGLIAIDYLTLMSGEKAERNDLAYAAVTKGLKALAKELNCVVVLLTQLNRGLESRADKRPIPSDSRDTGQVEQECDYWLGMYRESVYKPNADPTLTELILRSNRHGNTGTAYVDMKNGVIYDIENQQAAQARAESMSHAKANNNEDEFL